MTNDAAVACHRVRSAGYAGYGVWRDGDIPIDEAQYWESADSSFYIERAYSATTVAELRALIARAIPFLDDHHDAGPPSAGYKSDALESLITEMRNTLRQEKPE